MKVNINKKVDFKDKLKELPDMPFVIRWVEVGLLQIVAMDYNDKDNENPKLSLMNIESGLIHKVRTVNTLIDKINRGEVEILQSELNIYE